MRLRRGGLLDHQPWRPSGLAPPRQKVRQALLRSTERAEDEIRQQILPRHSQRHPRGLRQQARAHRRHREELAGLFRASHASPVTPKPFPVAPGARVLQSHDRRVQWRNQAAGGDAVDDFVGAFAPPRDAVTGSGRGVGGLPERELRVLPAVPATGPRGGIDPTHRLRRRYNSVGKRGARAASPQERRLGDGRTHGSRRPDRQRGRRTRDFEQRQIQKRGAPSCDEPTQDAHLQRHVLQSGPGSCDQPTGGACERRQQRGQVQTGRARSVCVDAA